MPDVLEQQLEHVPYIPDACGHWMQLQPNEIYPAMQEEQVFIEVQIQLGRQV